MKLTILRLLKFLNEFSHIVLIFPDIVIDSKYGHDENVAFVMINPSSISNVFSSYVTYFRDVQYKKAVSLTEVVLPGILIDSKFEQLKNK